VSPNARIQLRREAPTSPGPWGSSQLADGFNHGIVDGPLILGSVKGEGSEIGVVPILAVRHRIPKVKPCHLLVSQKHAGKEGSVVNDPASATKQNCSGGPRIAEVFGHEGGIAEALQVLCPQHEALVDSGTPAFPVNAARESPKVARFWIPFLPIAGASRACLVAMTVALCT
jgi:hypothetical protein